MATVVITFFLFVRLYVFKMDADYQDRPRERIISRRENRWSMNSQRLEQIVAELLKPVGDIRQTFNMDMCALLEEYLTEAGLHALEESDDEPVVAPNYAELALLLQHSATVYARKVDFLHQHVIRISESLHNTLQEEAAGEEGAGAAAGAAGGAAEGAGGAARRRRRASSAAPFARVALEAGAGARREPGPARPPPTLPRMYVELEPRVVRDHDAQLQDYAAEPVGVPADFHVTWRLQDGFLVEELEVPRLSVEALNPISLVELQAAIEAAAPASPPPAPRAALPADDALDALDELDAEPLHASTPLPCLTDVVRSKRKRRSDINLNDIVYTSIKIIITHELSRRLSAVREFSISRRWISRVVARRKRCILAARRARPPPAPRRGEHISVASIIHTWMSEGSRAGAARRRRRPRRRRRRRQRRRPPRACCASRASPTATTMASSSRAPSATPTTRAPRSWRRRRRRRRRAGARAAGARAARWRCARWRRACWRRARPTAPLPSTPYCTPRPSSRATCRACCWRRCSWPTLATWRSCRARRSARTSSRCACCPRTSACTAPPSTTTSTGRRAARATPAPRPSHATSDRFMQHIEVTCYKEVDSKPADIVDAFNDR